MRPYEVNKGETDAVHEKWVKKCIEFLNKKHVSYFTFSKMCKEMVKEFDQIKINDVKKPRVGVVGEILVKFSPTANNHVVDLLESEGAARRSACGESRIRLVNWSSWTESSRSTLTSMAFPTSVSWTS